MAPNRHVLTDLDTEWAALLRTRSATAPFRTWARDDARLAACGDLAGLIKAIRYGPFDASNELVWALLALAPSDALAARTVLQAIVPGLAGELRWLLSWARRVDPGLLDGGDIDQMLVTAAVAAVAHAAGKQKPWPLSSILRRTHRLLRRDVLVEERWRSHAFMTAEPRQYSDDNVEPPAAETVTALLRDARRDRVVDADDVALVWLTRVAGYQPDEVTKRFAATADCLRRRRHRAEQRLAAKAAV